jgi:hypothetical protein
MTACRPVAEPLRELDIRLIHVHLEGGVREALHLPLYCSHHLRMTVAGCYDANTTDEIYITTTLDVRDAGVVRLIREDRRRGNHAPRDGCLAPRQQFTI